MDGVKKERKIVKDNIDFFFIIYVAHIIYHHQSQIEAIFIASS
jgi:hypothetical protein